MVLNSIRFVTSRRIRAQLAAEIRAQFEAFARTGLVPQPVLVQLNFFCDLMRGPTPSVAGLDAFLAEWRRVVVDSEVCLFVRGMPDRESYEELLEAQLVPAPAAPAAAARPWRWARAAARAARHARPAAAEAARLGARWAGAIWPGCDVGPPHVPRGL